MDGGPKPTQITPIKQFEITQNTHTRKNTQKKARPSKAHEKQTQENNAIWKHGTPPHKKDAVHDVADIFVLALLFNIFVFALLGLGH